MRVAVRRNNPQTFVVLKQEPACGICAIQLQGGLCFTTLESPAGSGGQLFAIIFWNCNFFSGFVLCDVCLQKKSPILDVGWNVDSSEITRASIWLQVFPVLMFSSALGRIRDTSKPLYKNWRWAPSLSTPIPWDGYSGIVLILSEIFTVYAFDLMQA